MKTRHSSHTLFTRLLHMALAIAVIIQLVSSEWMITPEEGRQANWVFEVHEYSGLLALVFATGFWLVMAFRRRGTPTGLLFPWLSVARRRDLLTDLQDHWQNLKKLRLPEYTAHSPLASSIHGLGLLLILLMAGTGGLYYLALEWGSTELLWASTVIEIHEIFSTFVWVYLIGHSLLAIIHHTIHKISITEMWSVRP